MWVTATRIDGRVDTFDDINLVYFAEVGRPSNDRANDCEWQPDFPRELVLNPNVYAAFVAEDV